MADFVQTEFNSNVATLQRIDNILKDCRYSAYFEDVDGWFKHLAGLKREARVKMKHKKDKAKVCITSCLRCDCDARYDKLIKKITLYASNRNNALKYVLIKELSDFEDFLRDFLNDKGMLLKDETGMDETPDGW